MKGDVLGKFCLITESVGCLERAARTDGASRYNSNVEEVFKIGMQICTEWEDMDHMQA